MKQIGRPLSHESAVAHVTGAAKYVDDLWPTTARVAHAWPVQSPHAHARVVSVDASAARAMPGVLLVLTAGDVPGENDVGPVRHDEPLFPCEVCFVGHPVTWVVAESENEARLAAAAVVVAYEPLPAILGIEQAIAADHYLTEPERMQRGDAAEALRTAEHTLEGELYLNGQEQFYLETQAALAFVDESDAMMVHSSTQHPAETQEVVARVLGLLKHQVVVQCLRMGGAFGGKETQASTWAAVAALAASKLARPVRVRLTRTQDTTMTGKRHPFLARFKVGFGDDGKLRALVLELYADGGYSLDLSLPILTRALFHADNCYLLPNAQLVGRVCRTHHVSHTAFRGFGGPQGMLVIEDILDRVARTLGLAPHLVREHNFYREGDETHYGQPVHDAERIERIWGELKVSSDFERRRAEHAAFNARSEHKKRALAITPVKFGISFTTAFFNQAGALVLIYKDGSVQVNHGGTEMGQGLHTKMLQVAAHTLGLPLSMLRIMPTRTDKIPNTSATAASSGSDLNGAAVRDACESLRARLSDIAAEHFSTLAERVRFEDGRVFVEGLEHTSVAFADIVGKAYLARVPLFATGYYRTPNIHFDRDTGRGKPFHYYSYGAAVSEVEVDGFTGQYQILRADLLHDVGDSLSPTIDKGQVEGGFMQGVGWMTTEELVWGEQGTFLSSGASTYKLPTLGECPTIFHVDLLQRASEPGVVYGSKAVGEPPLMLAISVREALREAASAFGAAGITELSCPATPEAVYRAIARARQRTTSQASVSPVGQPRRVAE